MTRFTCFSASCIAIILCLATLCKCQLCERITIEDLGSTTTPTQAGLIIQFIEAGEGETSSVQVFAMSIVCESIPQQRDRLRFISVVANYTITPFNNIHVSQFEFQCNSGTWNSRSMIDPSDATFDTPVRRDCGTCEYLTSSVISGPYDNITHCVLCDGCSGLNQCGDTSNSCCNYYNNDICVAECPSVKPTLNEAATECVCAPGLTGGMCELDIDECTEVPGPCLNSGTCNNTFGGFECLCPSTFNGELCENDINECSISNPCNNDGICMNTIGGFNCSCTPGFQGVTCGDDVNECNENNICLNGATCLNKVGGFICICAPGTTGMFCKTDIDECANNMNPCQNGATCINNQGSFTCNCPVSYTGTSCEIDINECESNPCQNDGTCTTNSDGSYSCVCTQSWDGDNCDLDINECSDQNLCQNGGTCEDTQGSYMCLCRDRWDGQNCEDCTILSCTLCTGMNALCQECEAGFIRTSNGLLCTPELACVPDCVRGECNNGQCSCEAGYTASDCSELCISRIPGCESCSVSGNSVTCVECQTGLINDGNECKPTACNMQFCEECEDDLSGCKKCDTGYELKESQTDCIQIEQRPTLTSIEIIGLIVGCILFAILLLAVVACIISTIYRVKERPKMKRQSTKNVFQKHGANSNPLYLDTKATMGLAQAHGGVTAEQMLTLDFATPGYDDVNQDDDDFNSLSVNEAAAPFQYDVGLEEQDTIDGSSEEDSGED